MQIIPAIDLKEGKCVRLTQGVFTQAEIYSEDPVKYAIRWQSEGATRLHIVDLDGAKAGMVQPHNLNVVRQIMRRVNIPVQLGGGIRSTEVIERVLNMGVDRVILGTSVAQNDEIARSALMMYGEKIIVGIDARDGFVAVAGWQQRLDESAISFAKRMVEMNAKRIIFTDISRDGMLEGVNTAALSEMLAAVPIPIIASGGAGSLEDIHTLKAIKASNLEGVIIGKALYAGKIRLPEAISAAGKQQAS